MEATAVTLESGREALTRGAWEEARARFAALVREHESAEAQEGLAAACWWLLDLGASIEARERAHALFREQNDLAGAARSAVWLVFNYADRGDAAVANGWLQRADRLLESVPVCGEHAWVRFARGHFTLMGENDPATAAALARDAQTIAHAHDRFDLHMISLALEGLALVTEGDVTAGMPKLDEATAAALSGEMKDLEIIGLTCCYLIHACERVRDFERATQWCDRVSAFCRRWRYNSLFGVCRTHYATILLWRGSLREAEAELAALERESQGSPQLLVRSAMVRLAELRRRQGRLDEAAALFDQVPGHRLTPLGRAALALDRDDPAGAIDALEVYLRRVPPQTRTERVPALELLVRAQAARGDLPAARGTQAELAAIARAVSTETLEASATVADGIVRAAAGEHEAARSRFEDAIDAFARNNAGFEAARARLELARSLTALGRHDAATEATRSAEQAFLAMGAAGEAKRAAQLRRAAQSETTPPTPGLTKREIQVLALVAQGLTEKQVAGRLKLSEHTVHRHIANILTRSGLASRAAAVAHATKLGLI